MKTFLISLLFIILTATLAQSQIIISEIMYNPPESGADSLEYLEIFNSTTAPINLNGYTFVNGIEHVFGDVTLAEGDYLVLSKNPGALMSVMGATSIAWNSGGLKNDGELITLADADGNFIDTVNFEIGAPWPNFSDGAAGGGASIEFCLDTDDNAEGTNWKAATMETGDTINAGILRGTPGAANSAMCIQAAAETVIVTSNVFTPADITVNIGDRVLWKNEQGFHNVNGTLETYPDNPEGFGNGGAASAPWEYGYTFTKEGVYDYQCDPHVGLGMVGTVTVLNNLPNLVITEIMYNDPSSDDVDSLEFIEVYNAGTEDVSVGGLVLTSSVIDFTLPDSTLAAGEFMIIQKMFSTFINDLGLLTIPFTNGGLGNNSDSVTLSTGDGTVIDQVVYEDSGEWPEEADGLGSSLSLCDVSADNSDPANWRASNTQTDREFETGSFIFANPGALNVCGLSIVEASAIDEDGNAVNLGANGQVEGIVYGINMRPGGLQFTIIDEENNGIAIFSPSEDFGYEVVEGDLVRMQATVGQFNGLTQLSPSALELVSSDNALIAADTVSALGEDTESSLVTIKDVSLIDPSQWSGSGSGFNVDVSNGTDTFAVRIDADVVILYNNAYPTGTFNITGIGGQFDNSEPFLSGYQLLPRYEADIEPYLPFEETYPFRTIADVSEVDDNGVALALGMEVEVRGVAHGINFRPSGLQFTLIDDNNDGLGLFAGGNDFDYTYAEGDLLSIKGTIGQFNGLTQIDPDSITVISSGNELQEPTSVTDLGEETESQYIELEPVAVVDPTEWAGDGSSFNVALETSTGAIVTMRIDADSELSDKALPGNTLRVRGTGGQFDNSEPFTEGYQIFPSYEDDVVMVSSVEETFLNEELVLVFPNPVKQALTIKADLTIERSFLFNILGERVLEVNVTDEAINVSSLPAGQYFLHLRTKDGVVVKEITKL